MKCLWLGFFAALWLVVGIGSDCKAQVLTISDDKPQKPPKAANEVKDFPFESTAQPSPALRYEFWLPPIRRQPGNAVANLLRANVLYHDVGNSQTVEKRRNELEKKLEGPLSEFPVETARDYLADFRNVLDELAKAERVAHIEYDFRIHELRGTEVFSTLLPELQRSRDLARLLRVQSRLAIAEGRYEDAIQSMRTGFRLGEIASRMGEPFIIGKLIGIAINHIMLHEAEILAQQPNSPNLYWALASLPDDIGDMRLALEGERFAFENTLHGVMHLPSESITREAWQKRIVTTVDDSLVLLGQASASSEDDRKLLAQLIAGGILLAHGDASKAMVGNPSLDQDETESMSYAEATIRATRESLQALNSEFYKWSLVPRGEVNINERAEQVLKQHGQQFQPSAVIANLLLPGIQGAQVAGDRVLTKRNRLITIEAIRAYAAAHENRLPTSIDDLEPIPAWKQAGVAKPFEYQRLSDTEAILRTAPHADNRPEPDAEVRLILRSPAKR